MSQKKTVEIYPATISRSLTNYERKDMGVKTSWLKVLIPTKFRKKIERRRWVMAVSHVQRRRMYLLFSKSSYTEEVLKNFKSLKCCQNFTNGWVRDVLVKDFGERRLLIAKVFTNNNTIMWITSKLLLGLATMILFSSRLIWHLRKCS